jgi:flagellar motility protein MotE (MotC chaperone)
MRGKLMKIGILVLLGVVSFVTSLYITNMLTTSIPEGVQLALEGDSSQIDADALLLNGMAQASGVKMKPKERQLDELIGEVRAKLKQLDRRERDLNAREKRLASASDHLKAQIKELNDLKVELATAIGPLREARQNMLRFRALITSQEAANVEAAAKRWEKMDPANAARLIAEMWKTRQDKAATKILRVMSDKKRAAILDEMKEMGLAAEIIQKQLSVVREDVNL